MRENGGEGAFIPRKAIVPNGMLAKLFSTAGALNTANQLSHKFASQKIRTTDLRLSDINVSTTTPQELPELLTDTGYLYG